MCALAWIILSHHTRNHWRSLHRKIIAFPAFKKASGNTLKRMVSLNRHTMEAAILHVTTIYLPAMELVDHLSPLIDETLTKKSQEPTATISYEINLHHPCKSVRLKQKPVRTSSNHVFYSYLARLYRSIINIVYNPYCVNSIKQGLFKVFCFFQSQMHDICPLRTAIK